MLVIIEFWDPKKKHYLDHDKYILDWRLLRDWTDDSLREAVAVGPLQTLRVESYVNYLHD